MRNKKDILDFNHIDSTVKEEKFSEVKALYKFYHKHFWCYLNPIALGVISGSGLLLKTFSEIKDYEKKIEMCKFPYTTYEKVLVDLRSSLRGNQFNHTSFIYEMKLIDEMIIDLCPITDEFEKQYHKIFTSE